MENDKNKNTALLDQNFDIVPNENNKHYLSNKKVFPIEKKCNDSKNDDIRIFNIFDPESGRYIRKVVRKKI